MLEQSGEIRRVGGVRRVGEVKGVGGVQKSGKSEKRGDIPGPISLGSSSKVSGSRYFCFSATNIPSRCATSSWLIVGLKK